MTDSNIKESAVSPNHKYSFLTGLRGLAVIAVILEHSGRWWQNFGPFGVDCFFLLSAFLLTSALYQKCRSYMRSSKSASDWAKMLAVYYLRRFFRIYPFFVFCFFLLKYVIPDRIAAANFHARGMYEMTWYDVMTFKNTTHILWTLPVEIQYYFIIPVYCLVIAYSGRRAYRLNAVILMAVSYVSLVRPRFVHQPLSVHWPTFVTGSACGVLWVQVSKYIEKRPPKKFAILGMKCFSLFLVFLIISNVTHQFFWALLKKDPFQIGSHFQFTSLFLGMLLITETCFPSGITKFFEWSVLQFLGKACFPIYLLHSATYATIHQLPNWNGFICYIIGLTLVGKLGLMVEKQIDNVCVKLCKLIDSSAQFERVVSFADQSRKNISNSLLKKAGKRLHQLGLILQNKIPEMA